MKRKLITQMCNEWRSNLWMVVELVIVGVVLWAVFSIFAALFNAYQAPKGIDFDDICIGTIDFVPEDASTYQPYADSLHNEHTDLEILLTKLRSNPYVVSLGTGNNSIPYNYNYNGMVFTMTIGDTVQTYCGNRRLMSPDMIRTLRITGVNGESSEELARMIDNGEALISPAERYHIPSTPEKWVGRDMMNPYDSTTVHVGALINGIRRSDYEPVFGGVTIMKYGSGSLPHELAVRVQPGKQQEYLESLKNEDLEFGNAYVMNMMTIEERRDSAHVNVHVLIRNLTACALFVMIAVFLGFLGSFWYRTQQRVPEIALRKVNGATNRDIFRRFLSEGLLLLCVAAPFVIALSIWIIALLEDDLDSQGILVSNTIAIAMLPLTLAILAAMICAGIIFPARKAMKINPAEALKDQ